VQNQFTFCLKEEKMALIVKKALLILREECLGDVALIFDKEYPGWQLLNWVVTWPPTLVAVVEITKTMGAREEMETLTDLKHKGLIEFCTCTPATERVLCEAELPVAVWREEAIEPYQILYEMNPSGHFVLVFPLERTDIVERVTSARGGWRDPGETRRHRFTVPANANTALWLAEIREAYPEFVASQSAEAILDDFLRLPGLDWF
jgi:hypothetical protein